MEQCFEEWQGVTMKPGNDQASIGTVGGALAVVCIYFGVGFNQSLGTSWALKPFNGRNLFKGANGLPLCSGQLCSQH